MCERERVGGWVCVGPGLQDSEDSNLKGIDSHRNLAKPVERSGKRFFCVSDCGRRCFGVEGSHVILGNQRSVRKISVCVRVSGCERVCERVCVRGGGPDPQDSNRKGLIRKGILQ